LGRESIQSRSWSWLEPRESGTKQALRSHLLSLLLAAWSW
jgi:hypothetical protein